jgi:secondary thiamine-phosphate synthase enzyme
MPEFTVSTAKSEELIGITVQVSSIVSDVKEDILLSLSRIVPKNAGYRHSEGNSAAHVKASLFGTSEIVPFRAGKLALGQWQGIMLCEFDGPRSRKVIVELIGR